MVRNCILKRGNTCNTSGGPTLDSGLEQLAGLRGLSSVLVGATTAEAVAAAMGPYLAQFCHAKEVVFVAPEVPWLHGQRWVPDAEEPVPLASELDVTLSRAWETVQFGPNCAVRVEDWILFHVPCRIHNGVVLALSPTQGFPWDECSAEPVFSGLELVAMTVDRIHSERITAQEVERFRGVVEDQSELICRFDLQGKLTFVNGAYCRYFDKEPKELLGNSFFPLVPDEDQPIIDRAMASLAPRSPTKTYEHRVILRGGEIRWTQWTDRLLLDNCGHATEFQSVGRDITNLMMLAETLRESEERWHSILEGVSEAIYLWDASTESVLFGNPAFYRVFGVSESGPTAQMAQIWACMPVEDLAAIMTALREGVGTTSSRTLTYRINIPGAKLRWLQEFCFPIRSKPLDRVITCGVVRDISEQVESALNVEFERDLAMKLASCTSLDEGLDIVLEAALTVHPADSGGIYLVESEGLRLVRHRGLSERFIQSAALYPAESPHWLLVQRGTPEFQTHDGLAAHVGVRSTVREEEGLRALAVVPIVHHGKALAALNVASHTSETFADDAKRMLASLAAQLGGVLVRLRAEEAAQRGRENLQTLFDSLEDFLFVLGPQGHIVSMNPVVTQRLGYSSEELLGHHVLGVHPEQRRPEASSIIEGMLSGTHRYCPVPLQAKDGGLIPVETQVTRGRWNGSDALFGISRDISERLKAQEELARAKDELEDRVLERTRELEQVNLALVQQMRAREGVERQLKKQQKILRLLNSELLSVEEKERRRLAVEIHDRLSQSLALARINLDLATSLGESNEAVKIREGVGDLIERAITQAQSITLELSPPIVYEMGLRAALEWLADETFQGTSVIWEVRTWQPEPDLPEETRLLLFHISRELLNNVKKHAHATRVIITLRPSRSRAVLSVQDDGVGFANGPAQRSHKKRQAFGLFSVRERLSRVGGRLTIAKSKSKGALVEVSVPRK